MAEIWKVAMIAVRSGPRLARARPLVHRAWSERFSVSTSSWDTSQRGVSVRIVSTVTAAGALVGRDTEQAMLANLLAGVAAGRGGSVLIEGEPGIGKSTLVR